MGDSATAMRDPIFYRWHKYIDLIFDKYKGTIKPYTPEEVRKYHDKPILSLSFVIIMQHFIIDLSLF